MRGRGRGPNRQVLTIAGVVAVLLVAAGIIFGKDIGLYGTAGEEPTATPQQAAQLTDSDGDQIVDQNDACPNQGDQGYGLDSSGCPNPPPPPPDSDGDGIADPNDACPNQGDQGYGLDGSGCPNPPPPPPDSDGDGIADPNDACPNQGDQGYGLGGNGCPNPPPDSDADGIVDANDACPNQGDQGYGLGGNGCPNPPPPTAVPPTNTAVPSDTPVPPTNTPVPTDTPVPPTNTPVPTDTPVPPTNTPVPTDTPVPPTNTPVPTDTAVPPTNTPLPPTATFTPTPTGRAPQAQAPAVLNAGFEATIAADGTVTFSDTSTGTPTAWAWTFGDGGTSSEQNPSHGYEGPGEYNVSLTVTDASGASSTAQGKVTITEQQTQRMTCEFQMQPQGEQVPLTVNFTNTSTNATSYSWDFGVPGATSTDANPTYTYTAVGTYNITLTCQGPQGPLTATGQVTVTETPGPAQLAAQFTAAPTRGPAPLTVKFTDSSTGQNITGWQWAFGDGGSSSEQSPSHTYSAAGTYTVTLTITTQDGQTATATGSIQVVEQGAAPVPGFDVTPREGDAPLTVTVTDTTQGDISTWTWNFGDGSTANGQGPHQHTYPTAGTYTITLTVDGPTGGGTATKQVVALAQGAVVDAIFNFAVGGHTAQGWEVCFTNTSTGTITAQTWDFGDGSTSTEASPCHTYAAEGSYTVQLSVTGAGGETSTASRIVPVVSGMEAPVASYTVNQTLIQVNGEVQFNNTSTGVITGYQWDFGDGGTSTSRSPKHKYTAAGTYIVNLTVTGPGGSSQAASTTITVSESNVQILTCDFGGSTSVLPGQTITYDGKPPTWARNGATYTWTLDGVVVGSGEDLTYTWSTTGGTLVYTITTADGQTCSKSRKITASALFATFDRSPEPAGIGQQVCYTDRSRGSLPITSWLWDFGDGSTSTEQNPCHVFTALGKYTVKLTVSDGTNTASNNRSTNIKADQALNAIAEPNSGVAPLRVTFTAVGENLNPNPEYEWTFPGGTKAYGQIVNYVFTEPGQYEAVVRGKGPLGWMEARVVVNVGSQTDIRAAFTPSRWTGVAPMDICFTDRSVGDQITTWQWDLGNGQTSTEQNPCTRYETVGSFPVTLTVTNAKGLKASATNTIRTLQLSEGSSRFGIELKPNGEVCFSSQLGAGMEIVNWDFGDGTTSTEPNPCHTYPAGDYTVSLVVNGAEGQSVITRQIKVEVQTVSQLPDLSVTGTCTTDGKATFTITNRGGAMKNADTYTVTDASGATVKSGPVQLDAGASMTVNADAPGAATLTLTDAQKSASTNCQEAPKLAAAGQCLDATTVEFTLTNTGGAIDAAAGQSYTVTDASGKVVTQDAIILDKGQSMAIQVKNVSGDMTLSFPGGAPVTANTENCALVITPTSPVTPTTPSVTVTPPPTETPVPTEVAEVPPVCGLTSTMPVAGGGPGFPVIDMTTPCAPEQTAAEKPWTPITVGAGVCPDWFVYHTNQTGDWELFRYGQLPGNPDAEVNLSQGVGPRIYDVAPSRSPDGGWIAFASNRDGNWEIYVGTSDGTFQQRVTYNQQAVDVDPMWSPVGDQITYESGRDGNWEIYMVDVSTGVETRLTEAPASDLNPFWSPDGRKIVFQSDRDGFWQIYELDVQTLEVTRLSDGSGDDLNPAYSFDGKQIAFQSYRDGANSVIYVMNVDGSEPQAISDVEGDASLQVWSPDDTLIAYQSNLDGDLDIYVYELSSGTTRQITDNDIADYAPTWFCNAPTLIFTSDITEDSNLFEVPALPIDAPAIQVETDAQQLTDEPDADQYPVDSPAEENASRENALPRPAKNR